MPSTQQRLDQLLVARGLAESRERAQRFILAGKVRIKGQVADKPGRRVAADAATASVLHEDSPCPPRPPLIACQ